MIDIATLKTQLSGLSTRSTRKHTAEEWGTGDLQATPEALLPEVNDNVREALTRIAKQCQSIGPRVVNTKRFGTLGDINWGGENTLMDAALRQQNLESTADEMLEQSYYSGMITGITRRDAESGEVRIEPLVGHVEPVYSLTSPTHVIGIIHAWVNTADPGTTAKWTVRLYDLPERSMREWRGLSTPDALKGGVEPDETIMRSAEYPSGAPIPRFAIVAKGRDRMPLGEVAKLLPLLFADWSSQVRGDRIEESTAIPQLVVKGEVEDGTEERSPTHVIRVIDEGDAKYIIPGDLTSLHEHHNRKLERIREDGNLPGGFLGSQTPSGEALREANAKFISSNRYYAARLSRVLTELTADLAEAESLGKPPEVTVTINREFTKAQDIEDTVTLYGAELTSHEAAVRHITPFLPTWEDDDVEEFIEAHRELIPEPRTPAESADDDLEE